MKSRSEFDFVFKVRKEFTFLEDGFGFAVTAFSDRKVRYESNKVYVQIEHGDYDFSISLFFGRLKAVGARAEMFDFALFLHLANPQLCTKLGDAVAEAPEKVREIVQVYATALRTEGTDILNGADIIFDGMKSARWI